MAHTGCSAPEIVAKRGRAASGGWSQSSVINGSNKAVFAEFDITEGFIQGFVVSIALVGSAVGAFVGGRLAQRFGRRRVMLVAAVLFLVAGLGIFNLFAVLSFFYVWRFVKETKGTELEAIDGPDEQPA
ncbi:MAG: CDP-archaeol synthase [Thermoleophilia bacterium]|nr:CDP-archaeol synthase [Thermoleophilia bacterium]MBJ7333278.1 CDP-archaeol synthase [Thermoleophilia bacterium]